MIGRDVEVDHAILALRAAGRRVSRSRFGRVWTVGLATYDRRQLLAAADRVVAAMSIRQLDGVIEEILA